MGEMFDPAHPGEILRENVEAAGWTVTETARRIGVTRAMLSRVLNGHAGVSAEMAIRLESLGWGSADLWVRMQGNFNLARARRSAAA